MGETGEIPDALNILADFANKAQGITNPKRRWRASGDPIRKVVSLAELIKKREQKALEKQPDEVKKLPEVVPVQEVEPPKFVPNYFEEETKEVVPNATPAMPSKCKWGKK